MYGRKYMGNERTTFVIGPDGTVAEVLRKVKPGQHDDLVLAALERVLSVPPRQRAHARSARAGAARAAFRRSRGLRRRRAGADRGTDESC